MKAKNDVPPIAPRWSLALILALALAVLFVVPLPADVPVQGRRLLAVFLCAILAMMLRPIPVGAAVFAGLALTVPAGIFSISQALSAYASSTVWLVMSAFFIARALIGSGLARRIALVFVRMWGTTSLGIGYALAASDMVLAGIIPSNGARVGGVILPITRTLAEVYRSLPGKTAALLGTYLMLALYESDVVACAMFLTGQAGNPIGARLAEQQAGVVMSWYAWLRTACVPAVAALAVTPWVVYRLSPPEIRHTPQAAELARRELEAMGPLCRREKIVLAVFVMVCGLWATSSVHGLETTTVAFLGVAVLLLTKVLSWREAMQEHVGWDVFVWYGGMIRMGEGLNEFGLTGAFAGWISSQFAGWSWPVLAAAVILVYFYAHYAFASITTHLISMYAPFLGVLVAGGAPPALVAYMMVFYSNLSAALTHYGTTPAPIIFAAGYVSHGTWWKTGLWISLVHLAVWSAIGLPWWKYLGLW